MRRILHLSDFHLTADMSEPQKNKTITSFLKKLRNDGVKIDVIVYTGDLIDSKEIAELIKKIPDHEREAEWNAHAMKTFKLAQKYMSFIRDQLGVSNDNIIVCCGNHDVNRYSEHSEKMDCDIRKISTSEDRFKMFNQFCRDMGLRNCSSNTYFREDVCGFNFIVVNSNFTDEKGSGLCTNCNSIIDVIENNKESLKKNTLNKKRVYNIFVSHSPWTDFCDYFNYEYPENNFESRLEHIRELFGSFYAGDKHSSNITGNDYLMGAPLKSDQITYGIYEYDDKNYDRYGNLKMNCRRIRYQKGKWNIYESNEEIDKIVGISLKYIKNSGVHTLYGVNNIDVNESIEKLESFKHSTRWQQIDSLFRSFTTLQKPVPGQAGENVSIDGHIVNNIVKLINEEKGQFPIVLRGAPKLGKSTLLTIVYINMLHCFMRNSFDYIPIYFNLDECFHDGTECANIKKRIKEIFDSGVELMPICHKPICYIFDGMKQCTYVDDCIEDYIVDHMKEYLTIGEYKNKVVFSIDSDEIDSGMSTKIHKLRNAEKILYFNAITTNKIHNGAKYISCIDAFSKLYGGCNADCIKSNIKKLRFKYIDLNTLINFKDYLNTTVGTYCKADLYRDLSDKLIEPKDMKNVCEICYGLYYKNEWYNYKGVSNHILYLLKKEVNLRNYLIASHYVYAIRLAIDKENGIDLKKSILNECFNDEISSYISDIICRSNDQNILKLFEERYYDKLSFKGKSMLTYLCGRMGYSNTDLKELLERERKILENVGVDNEDALFFKSVAERSIIISSITGTNHHNKMVFEYLDKLISDSYMRKVNRMFYLLYYGDRTGASIPFQNEIMEGFDFYNVYHTLSTKLNEWYKKDKQYRLLEIELFTLCDLIQQRIDNPISNSQSDASVEVPSIFYHEKHNRPVSDRAFMILSFITDIIKKYLNGVETDRYNEVYKMYLHEKEKEFRLALNKISSGYLHIEDSFDFSWPLKECSQISKIEKIGWKIKDDLTTINESQYDLYRKNRSYETVLEHTYDCFLIGLFYLPTNSKNKNYNKQKILNMLLIHDIGECYSGDFPPFYDKIDEVKKTESIFNKGLFLKGVHSNIADLTDYLMLWEQWEDDDTDDINKKIAVDIDKIQMIYKMFTLLKNTDIKLTKERIQKFLFEKRKIKTEEGKKIYETIISKNYDFNELIEKYSKKYK